MRQGLFARQGVSLKWVVAACPVVLTPIGASSAGAEPPRLTPVTYICVQNPISLHDRQEERIATPIRNISSKPRYPKCEVEARRGEVAWLVGIDDKVHTVWFRIERAPNGDVVKWHGNAGETSIEIRWAGGYKDEVLFFEGDATIIACNRDGCTRQQVVTHLLITNSF